MSTHTQMACQEANRRSLEFTRACMYPRTRALGSRPKLRIPKTRNGCKFHLYVSPQNLGAWALVREIELFLAAAKVRHARMHVWTHARYTLHVTVNEVARLTYSHLVRSIGSPLLSLETTH